jgi:hypothetical protein
MFDIRTKMTKANLIMAFRCITEAGVGVSYSRFYKVTMRLLRRLILRPSAQISCCVSCIITKLYVTIYISVLYKTTIVSIDVITQRMLERHNFLHDCLQEILILLVFKTEFLELWKTASLYDRSLF